MLLAANIVSFIGCVIMVLCGFIQKKKTVLVVQCIQIGFQTTANFLLNATAGMICGIISIIRNVIYLKTEGTRLIKILLILAQVVLTGLTWNGAWVELLPVLSMVIFTWMVDTKNEILFKVAFICSQLCWVFYDGYYCNIPGCIFDALTVLSNLTGICMLRKGEKT